MFLARSAFWLTVAFLVIKPGVDLGASASALKDQAMATGHKLVIEQIINGECQTLQCAGGQAVLSLAAMPQTPSVDVPMQNSSIESVAPLPRPRPDWMG